VPSATPRGRGVATANELASQIALVDAARAALASGGAARALASVRDYQAEYPNGTFRPEVAAIKIEALVKLNRTAEARALAERFASNYGPGPLADRVARLVGTAQP
jgi:outer membrane protein assembly factor BamD (BamD/ComL family)